MITSRANPLIVKTAALKEKKYRDSSSLFIFEGEKLFSEAVGAGIEIENVFFTESEESFVSSVFFDETKKNVVSEEVLRKISTEKAPQGVICVAKYIDKLHRINTIYNVEKCKEKQRKIILDSIRDPGNLGTIIRASLAFGIGEVILSGDCADIYNAKTVRASMGTVFRQKITVCTDLCASIAVLRASGFEVLAAMLDDSAARLNEIRITDKTVFIVGNEGHGISSEVAEAASGRVYIPMEEGAESLNAAMAATVFMWQGFSQ